MELYHFRVHIDNLELDKLLLFIRSNSTVVLIVKEMGDRPHIHSIITPTKTVSTFRQNFLKTFPMCKGNKCYSLEIVKNLQNLQLYLCKGAAVDVAPLVLYTTIDTQLYHENYWKTNNLLKEDSAVKRQKQISWLQQVKVDFCKDYPTEVARLSNPIECRWKPDDVEVKNYKIAQQKLLGFILGRLGQTVKVLDDNVVARMYKGIQNSIIQEGVHYENFTIYMFDKLNL